MKFTIGLTAGVIAGVFCGSLYGQERLGVPDEVRKGADYLVGQWAGEGTMNGQPASMQMWVRWARGNQYQLYRWTITSSGKKVFGNAIGGFDHVRDQWVEYMMESNGTHSTNLWPHSDVVNEGMFQGKQSSVRDGKEVTAKLTVERKGPKTWTYRVETDDEDSGVVVSMTFKKVDKRPRAATGTTRK